MTELPPEILFIIAQYLDCISLCYLVRTNKTLRVNLDCLWEEQLKLHFPSDTKTTHLLPIQYEYYPDFNFLKNQQYESLSEKAKKLFNVLERNSVELFEQFCNNNPFQFSDFQIEDANGCNIENILKINNNDALNHHIFDYLCKSPCEDDQQNYDLLELGIRLNLARGMFKEKFTHPKTLELFNKHSQSPLRLTAYYNALQTARLFLDLKIDDSPEIVSASLCDAAAYGFLDMVKLLYSHSADLNFTSTTNADKPILAALEKRHTSIVKYLLEDTNVIKAANLNTVFELAVKNGYSDILEDLLTATKINIAEGNLKESLLSLALEYGRINVVNVLLKHGMVFYHFDLKKQRELLTLIINTVTNISKNDLTVKHREFSYYGSSSSSKNKELIKLLLISGIHKDLFNEKFYNVTMDRETKYWMTGQRIADSPSPWKTLDAIIKRNIPSLFKSYEPKLSRNWIELFEQLLLIENTPIEIHLLLKECSTDFQRMVIILAILNSNAKTIKDEIIAQLSYSSIEDCKKELIEALTCYLNNKKTLFSLLQNHVVRPLNVFMKLGLSNEKTKELALMSKDDALFYLAFFTGLIYQFLQKNSTYLGKKLKQLLLCHNQDDRKDDRESPVKSLIISIDKIINVDKDEGIKIAELKQVVIDFYYRSRMAIAGSENKLFLGFNGLSDELRKIMIDDFKLDIPKYIQTGSPIPIISIPCTHTL